MASESTSRHSWLHAATELRPAGDKGLGVFATARISRGEVVAAFGGHVVDRIGFQALSESHQRHSLQIADDLFMVCPVANEPADFINHSCEPNTGISGSVMLVAIVDIAIGDEITFDYAMCDADDYDEFECCCGSPLCRHKVTSNDWMDPELQRRYRGFFSSYLQARIDGLACAPEAHEL